LLNRRRRSAGLAPAVQEGAAVDRHVLVREPLAELSDADEQRARELYRDIEAFIEDEGL